MSNDRRAEERRPSFTQADVLVRDPDGQERTLPMMLRDVSPSGLGGVYVGQDLPDIGDEYFLYTDGEVRPIRLAWWKKIAEYVLLLGFDTGYSLQAGD